MTNRDGFRGLNDAAGAKSPYVNQKGPQPNGSENASPSSASGLFVDDVDFQLYVGDVLEVLADMPDESVHCVVTSPPYWGLRDYGTGLWDGGDPDCDHALRTTLTADKQMASSTLGGSKHTQAHQKEGYKDVCGRCGASRVDQQLGLEATPELFVEAMVDVFQEVRRVLRADGTCWLNLGDSYAAGNVIGRTDAGRNFTGGGGNREGSGNPGFQGTHERDTGLKQKDLVGIPWRVAFALQADGWWLRSDIVWAKPNPMPESVTDRPTKAHEYVFLLTRSPRYFFDQEAVREAAEYGRREWGNGRIDYDGGTDGVRRKVSTTGADPSAGRNIRSVWEIATQPYPDAHFATFPEALPERCIRAGTSERGCCSVCGAPWERVVVATGADNGRVREDVGDWIKHKGGNADGKRSLSGATYKPQRAATDDWRPTCSCAAACGADATPTNTAAGLASPGSADVAAAARNLVACTVLDPFIGSGTTALVARRLGRRSIGIELNPEYAALCARRLQQLSLFAGTA